jgi:hypothetical protein
MQRPIIPIDKWWHLPYIAAMKKITIRLPDDLHEALVSAAKKERRPVNTQIIMVLERGTRKRTRSWAELEAER